MYSLEGQIAIITGGARGIGKGICEVFCKAGATVALWDVLDEGTQTADQIEKDGGSIFFQKVEKLQISCRKLFSPTSGNVRFSRTET